MGVRAVGSTWEGHRFQDCLACSVRHEAIVLTHEGIDIEVAAPYHACRLRPLTVQEFVGRAAKLEPPCPMDQAVYFFWKDRRAVGKTGLGRGRGGP